MSSSSGGSAQGSITGDPPGLGPDSDPVLGTTENHAIDLSRFNPASLAYRPERTWQFFLGDHPEDTAEQSMQRHRLLVNWRNQHFHILENLRCDRCCMYGDSTCDGQLPNFMCSACTSADITCTMRGWVVVDVEMANLVVLGLYTPDKEWMRLGRCDACVRDENSDCYLVLPAPCIPCMIEDRTCTIQNFAADTPEAVAALNLSNQLHIPTDGSLESQAAWPSSAWGPAAGPEQPAEADKAAAALANPTVPAWPEEAVLMTDLVESRAAGPPAAGPAPEQPAGADDVIMAVEAGADEVEEVRLACKQCRDAFLNCEGDQTRRTACSNCRSGGFLCSFETVLSRPQFYLSYQHRTNGPFDRCDHCLARRQTCNGDFAAGLGCTYCRMLDAPCTFDGARAHWIHMNDRPDGMVPVLCCDSCAKEDLRGCSWRKAWADPSGPCKQCRSRARECTYCGVEPGELTGHGRAWTHLDLTGQIPRPRPAHQEERTANPVRALQQQPSVPLPLPQALAAHDLQKRRRRPRGALLANRQLLTRTRQCDICHWHTRDYRYRPIHRCDMQVDEGGGSGFGCYKCAVYGVICTVDGRPLAPYPDRPTGPPKGRSTRFIRCDACAIHGRRCDRQDVCDECAERGIACTRNDRRGTVPRGAPGTEMKGYYLSLGCGPTGVHDKNTAEVARWRQPDDYHLQWQQLKQSSAQPRETTEALTSRPLPQRPGPASTRRPPQRP